MESQNRQLERNVAVFKHCMKENQKKAEFAIDARRKLETQKQEFEAKLKHEGEIREESLKLQRKVINLEKEVN